MNCMYEFNGEQEVKSMPPTMHAPHTSQYHLQNHGQYGHPAGSYTTLSSATTAASPGALSNNSNNSTGNLNQGNLGSDCSIKQELGSDVYSMQVS